MKKVNLNMSEENKYLIIKRFVERDGNKLNAAVKLNCSERTVNRLIKKYKLEGKSVLFTRIRIESQAQLWMKQRRR